MAEGAPDPVATLVRDAAFDAYAAGLFAPAEARPHLYALQAFDIELSRVRDLTREPLPGEMRFQWWRDALADPSRADAAAHPVMRALEAAIRYGALPRQALQDLIDARNDDLYDDPLPTVSDLEARLGATRSALLRLASLVLARGRDPGGADAAGHGGLALGLTQIARELSRAPRRVARLVPVELLAAQGVGQGDLDRGAAPEALIVAVRALALRHLDAAQAAYSALDPVAAPAFLPLALVPSDLMRRGPGDGLRWLRLARLWRASRRSPPF